MVWWSQARSLAAEALAGGGQGSGPGASRAFTLCCLLALAGGVALRLGNPLVMDLRFAHDAQLHLPYLNNLLHLRLTDYYVLPWYYLACLLHALPLMPFWAAGAVSELQLLSFGVALCNLHIFLWLLAGLWRLARRLELAPGQTLAWLALCATLPPLVRSLNMVRPENLQLALLPWIVVMAWDLGAAAQAGDASRRGRIWLLAVLAAACVTQKVGGAAAMAGVGLVMLLDPGPAAARRLADLIGLAGLALAITAAAAVAYHLLTGTWIFWDSDATGFAHYLHSAPARFFYTFDPAHVWADPWRNAQRYSMWNILYADLFGDYWQYAIFNTNIGPVLGRSLARARLGLAAASLFGALTLSGAVCLLRDWLTAKGAERRPRWWRAGLSLQPLLGLAYVALGCLLVFNPAKGDTIKWEYLVWGLPFLCLPAALLPGRLRGGRGRAALEAALAGLMLAGLFQSCLPLRWLPGSFL